MKINKEKILNITKLVTLALIIGLSVSYVMAEWETPPAGTPPACPTTGANPKDGCFTPINVSGDFQYKDGTLGLGGLIKTMNGALFQPESGNILNTTSVGTQPAPQGQPLLVDVEGAIGATYYCDKEGNNCVAAADIGDGDSSGGVNKIIQGSNIYVEGTPSGNGFKGDVMISAISSGESPTIDELVWQRRVTGNCAEGSSIRQINKNGTVECESDDSGSGGNITPTTTDLCSATGGGDPSVCPVFGGSYKFCALAYNHVTAAIGSRAGCSVYKDYLGIWNVEARADVGAAYCKAICF